MALPPAVSPSSISRGVVHRLNFVQAQCAPALVTTLRRARSVAGKRWPRDEIQDLHGVAMSVYDYFAEEMAAYQAPQVCRKHERSLGLQAEVGQLGSPPAASP